jgi:hypothetical protein
LKYSRYLRDRIVQLALDEPDLSHYGLKSDIAQGPKSANKRHQLEMKRPPTEATLMKYKQRQNRRSKNNEAHQEKRKVSSSPRS